MNREERDRLVEDNQSLVRSVALSVSRNISRPAFDLDDLVGWGQIGLMEAAESYDKERRDFQSWAFLRVRGAMIDGMRSMDMFPRKLYEVRRNMRSCSDELTSQLGRHPEHNEVADSLDISDVSYRDWAGRIRQMEVMSSENSNSSDEFLAGVASEADDFYKWERSYDIKRAVCLLRERERCVIFYTYWAGLTQYETSQVMGIDPSRVHQIKVDAVRTLRERLAGYVED
jgi:RNA polymerase sigma factor for flagellar operon FliA